MATSITIDNLDDGTFDRLTSEAQRLGKTPDAVAADLLRDALAVKSPSAAQPAIISRTPLTPDELRERNAAIKQLAGTWTEEDLRNRARWLP